MQISDLMGQYNHSISAGTEKVTGTKGVENLVSSLKSLTKGNIFEGTVSSMKNGRVTLSLSNGTQVSARMEGKVALTEGQSMFFQVKSNDGATISIRPFVVDGNGVNYTLMQALSAAGLPAQPNFLSMVDKMMEEQMPIDRASLQHMARLANTNGNIDVRTLVQMCKLGIELTPENAAQFENYLGDKQAITAAIDNLIDELPLAMQGSSLPDEAMRQMNSQVLSVITEGLEPAPSEGQAVVQNPAAEGQGTVASAATEGQSAVQSSVAENVELTVQGSTVEGELAAQGSADAGVVAQEGVPESPVEGVESLGMPTVSIEPAGANLLLQAAAATAEGVELVITPAEGRDGLEVAAGPELQAAAADQAHQTETAVSGGIPQTESNAVEGQAAAPVQAGEAVSIDQATVGETTSAESASVDQVQAEGAAPTGQTSTGEPVVTATGQRPTGEAVSAERTPAGERMRAAQGERTFAGKTVLDVQNLPTEPEHTLASVLNQRQLNNLNGMLKELVGQKSIHYDGDKSTVELLNDLRELLDSKLPIDRGNLERLIGSKEFKEVVKDALERQWTIRPEELTGSDKINKLYSKLDGQMNRIADVLRATGQENVNFTQTAADIRSNVEFMNQINQMYTYVQIPLKMSGQTASGELYIYTNKKALAEGDKELTAFLHLDMDNLGPTDISVKLLNRQVSTNFYLENDEAYNLIQKNIPILEERLRAKGYNCTVSVVNENRHVNFVEDFLKKDQPSAGQLHRYSFDMRA